MLSQPARALHRLSGDAIAWAWQRVAHAGAIRDDSRQAARFAAFGKGSTIGFPPAVLHGVERIEVGARAMIGPNASLSAGMLIPLDEGPDPLLSIGDGCVLGKGVTIVAHDRIAIGNDTMAGNYVFITDQNHGYEDLEVPIGRQMWRNAPVSIGPACWIGHGSIILPGVTIGRHVVVAAGSVVTGDVEDRCVVAGAPARVIRRHVPGQGWVPAG